MGAPDGRSWLRPPAAARPQAPGLATPERLTPQPPSSASTFRTVADFISVGTDGKTPAKRLELAKQPLTCEDIPWPGEAAPRLRHSRRKGKQLRGYGETHVTRGASRCGRRRIWASGYGHLSRDTPAACRSRQNAQAAQPPEVLYGAERCLR